MVTLTATGAASAATCSEVAGSPFPDAVAAANIDPLDIAFSPDSSLLVTAGNFTTGPSSGDEVIGAQSVAADGSLPAPYGSLVRQTEGLDGMALSPAGGVVASVDHQNSALYLDSVGSSGVHSAGSPISLPATGDAVAYNPSGSVLAVTFNNGSYGSLELLSTSETTATPLGGVVQLPPPSGDANSEPMSVAFSPDGQDVAVADSGSGEVFLVKKSLRIARGSTKSVSLTAAASASQAGQAQEALGRSALGPAGAQLVEVPGRVVDRVGGARRFGSRVTADELQAARPGSTRGDDIAGLEAGGAQQGGGDHQLVVS